MSAPTQFRKKPVVISAIQWTGENLVDVIHFTDGRPPNNKSSHAGMMWDQYVDVVRKDGLKIFTMEGKMDASIGDWIIKGVKGEHYPCKPEIFALTYDDASASTDLSQAAVAAALSAAASELDGELSEESTALLGAWAVEWAKQATSVQDHIRALITPAQHDALAAHVAAEVAKARAAVLKEIGVYLKTDNHDGATHRVIDIAYNAFMYGASKRNSEDGGPCDWFIDTRPFIIGRIDAISEALAQIGGDK